MRRLDIQFELLDEGTSGPFDDLLAASGPEARQLTGRLRRLILSVLRGASEHVWNGQKLKAAMYSVDHESHIVCGIRVFPDGCRLIIYDVHRSDAPRLDLKGRGSRRYMEFRGRKVIPSKDVRQLLKTSLVRVRRRKIVKTREYELVDGNWVEMKRKE